MERYYTALALELVVRERSLIHRRYTFGWLAEGGPALGSTTVHQHDVHGDAIQPGREPRAVPKVSDAAMHLKEDLLNDVFEVGRATQHALGQARDVLAVRSEQLPKGLGI